MSLIATIFYINCEEPYLLDESSSRSYSSLRIDASSASSAYGANNSSPASWASKLHLAEFNINNCDDSFYFADLVIRN